MPIPESNGGTFDKADNSEASASIVRRFEESKGRRQTPHERPVEAFLMNIALLDA